MVLRHLPARLTFRIVPVSQAPFGVTVDVTTTDPVNEPGIQFQIERCDYLSEVFDHRMRFVSTTDCGMYIVFA